MDLKFGRILRLAVFALLFVSTLTGLFLSDKLWTLWDLGELPLWAALAPPVLFFLFMVVFAVDRLHAVRARSLPAHRAMFHVGTSVLFFMLLLPHPSKNARLPVTRAPRIPQSALTGDDAAQFLLTHDDEAVRAATCLLLAGALKDTSELRDQPLWDLMGQRAQDDSAPRVREACQAALDHLSGGIGCLPEEPDNAPPPPDDDQGCLPEPQDETDDPAIMSL